MIPFIPDNPVEVMIVGAQPSVNDLRAGQPFAGTTGKELSKMLHEAGFIETECCLTYVTTKRLTSNEKYLFAKNKTEAKKKDLDPLFGKYPTTELVAALEKFNRLVEEVQPNLIIALGETALWATTGNSGITKWRGSVLEGLTGVKVVPTYAPDKIMVKWDWRWIAVQDLRRAKKEAECPEISIPPYRFLVRPSYEATIQWIQNRLIMAGLKYESSFEQSARQSLSDNLPPGMAESNLQTSGSNNPLGLSKDGEGSPIQNSGGDRIAESASSPRGTTSKWEDRHSDSSTGTGDRSETGHTQGRRGTASPPTSEVRGGSGVGGLDGEKIWENRAFNEEIQRAAGREDRGVQVRSDIAPLLLSVDIETRAGHIECLALADSIHEAICIPLMTRDNDTGYWSIEEEILIVKLLRELLTHPNVHIVGQNFLYDAQYFAKHWGIIPNAKHDTMYEHHVAFAGLPKGLDFLSSLYCNFHRYWKDEGKEFDPTLGEEERWNYNCKDAVITLECHEAIQMTLTAFGLETPAQMQMRLFRPLLRMMLRGTRFDMPKRDKMGPELMDAICQTETWLVEVVKDLVPTPKSKTAKPWYTSPTQLGNFLYNVLGLPQQRHRKTGRPTTDDDALQKLRKKEPSLIPFFDKLAELRSLGVFYNTFVKAPLDPDNRIRCSFNPSGTETYRLSSSSDAFGYGTNLQNIPKGNEL